jgi:hypothetical protein
MSKAHRPEPKRLEVMFTTGNDPESKDLFREAYRLFTKSGHPFDPDKIRIDLAGIEHYPSREVRRMVADDVRGGMFKTVHSYREEVRTEYTGFAWIARVDVDVPEQKLAYTARSYNDATDHKDTP